MITNKERVKSYLESEPLARERKNKIRAIVNLLMRKYPKLEDLQKEWLVEVIKDAENYSRVWRKVLQDHPELRGTDYSEKDSLEIEAQRELGYNL